MREVELPEPAPDPQPVLGLGLIMSQEDLVRMAEMHVSLGRRCGCPTCRAAERRRGR